MSWVLKPGEDSDGLGQKEGKLEVNVQGMLELWWGSGMWATDGEQRGEGLGRLAEVTLATSHCPCSVFAVC